MLFKDLKFTVLLACLLFFYCLTYLKGWETLNQFVQPLFILFLAGFLILKTGLRGRFHRRTLNGLLFLLLAILLIGRAEVRQVSITWVMISIYIAHIFFISAFYLDFRSAPELDKSVARIALISCVLCSFAFYIFLRPYTGYYSIAVLIYIFLSSMLIMMSTFRRLRINQISFFLGLSGSILLALSALLYALNQFVLPLKYEYLDSQLAFMIALYLIVRSAIARKLLLQK